MTDNIAVSTKNLNKSFGEVKALKNINLTIKKGLVYGLLGPNGAGKTTLIRLLTGATKATGGELSVLGLDPTQQKHKLRGKIGYMPQTPALYEDLSAIDNIRFFGRAKRVDNLNQRMSEVLEFVGLEDRANDEVYKFSGGMKQRVSLACALVHQPEFLLLDEPTSGIDPKLRERFWEHFRELASLGTTILVSTHQMDEAMHCHRLAILHRGTLLAENTPQKFLWEKKAKIKLWKGDVLEEHSLSHYPDKLPSILQKHGLRDGVSRIEIVEDNLETVILNMINQKEGLHSNKDKDHGNN